jgi:hypothetical protein
MARYMIPPKTFSLTTLPGAFIIIFTFLMLPVYGAHELGTGWPEADLALLLAGAAVPSLGAAFWIAHWVEKKQAQEWIEIHDQGVVSSMRTRSHPHDPKPMGGQNGRQQEQALTAAAGRPTERCSWRDVHAVELRRRRSSRTPGTHYQICLITDDDIVAIPLNDEILGTRHMVGVDQEGRPLGKHDAGEYPGTEIVQEIHNHVRDVPWVVKDVFDGKDDRKEKQLAFTGIADPWSGEVLREPEASRRLPRRLLIVAVVVAALISMFVCGFFVWHRSRSDAERKSKEALRERKAKARLLREGKAESERKVTP